MLFHFEDHSVEVQERRRSFGTSRLVERRAVEAEARDSKRAKFRTEMRDLLRQSRDPAERRFVALAEQCYGIPFLMRCGCHRYLAEALVLGISPDEGR